MLSRINGVIRRTRENQQGLTLIELLIIIGIVGIIAAIALPVLLNLLSSNSKTAQEESAAQVTKFVSDWTAAGYATAYIAPSDSSLGAKYEGKTIAYTDTNNDGSPEPGEPIIAEITGSEEAASAPTFTNGSSIPGGEVGVAYPGFTFAASGYPAATFTASGLPAGLHLALNGVLSGTPSATFDSVVVITASNGAGTATVSPVFDIAAGSGGSGPTATLPQFGQAVVLPDAQVGQSYSTDAITVSGTPAPVFSAFGLPAGLTINSVTGAITGTPTTAGNDETVTITITNSAGSSSATNTMNVAEVYTVPSFDSAVTLPDAQVGVAYTASLPTVSGNPAPTVSVAGLPAGLSFNSSNNTVSGTPTTAGNGSTVTFTVTNIAGSSSTTTTMNVADAYTVPEFTSAVSFPDGQAGVSYSHSLSSDRSGTPTPTFSATGLPAGLTISSSGVVSGTPTVPGSYTVAVTLSNVAGSVSSSTALYVAPAYTTPQFTSAVTVPDGQAGVAYSSSAISVTGNPTPTFSTSGLPAGLNINSSTGKITGTPTTAVNGTTFTITISNAAGSNSTVVSISIAPAYTSPQFTSAFSFPAGRASATYSSSAISVTGNPTPTFSATGLPSGLTMSSSDGSISGTPTAAGSFTVSVTLTNVAGSITSSGSMTIAPAYTTPQFTSALSFPDGRASAAYSSGAITVTGNPTPTFSATGLPSGLTMSSSDGSISGTPTAAGSFTVSVTITNVTGSTTASGSMNITPAYTTPQFTSALSFSAGRAAAAYSSSAITVTGNPTPTFSATGLPSGVAMSSADGSVSGTPTVSGTFTVSVTLTNVAGTVTASGSMVIAPAYTVPQFTSAISVPDGQAGTPYTATISNVSGNPAPTFSSSDLPAGLSINSATGAISGTPTTAGNSVAFHITLTNVAGSITAAGSMNIAAAYTVPQFTSALSFPAGQATVAYTSSAISVTGNPTPTFSASGLPAGLSISSSTGAITGTPTTAGTSTVSVTITNVAGSTTASGSMVIAAAYSAPQFTASISLANAQVGVAYSNPAIPTTGNPAATYSATGLPSGLTMNSSTGAITGTATTVASGVSVTVTATNVAGSISSTVTMNVIAAYTAPVFGTYSTQTGHVGTAYSLQVSATGNPTPTTYTVNALPAGLSMTSAGLISGTPTTQGTNVQAIVSTTTAGGTSSATIYFTFSTWVYTYNAAVTESNYGGGFIAESSDGSAVVATDGSLLRYSTNYGVTWNSDSNYLYGVTYGSGSGTSAIFYGVSSTGQLYKTTNGGATWASYGTAPSNVARGAAISSDGSHAVEVVNNTGLVYVTTNSGATWSSAGSTSAAYNLTPSISSNGTVMAVSGGAGVFVSTNSGTTWVKVIATGGGPISMSSDGSIMYYGGSTLQKSTNSGTSWSTISGAPASQALKTTADGSMVVMGSSSTSNYMYVSRNGGTTFTQGSYQSGNAWVAVAIDSDGGYVYGDSQTSSPLERGVAS